MNKSTLSATLSSVLDTGEYVIDFPLSKIRINPQARRKYKPEKVEEMAASLKQHGQMQPCIISLPDSEGYCDMFFGHTRFLGHEKIGSETLKAIQRKDPPNKLVIQLAENMHRQELDIVDTALSIADLSREMKPKQICQELSVKSAWVSKMQAIGKLPVNILDELSEAIGDIETFYMFAQLHKKNPEAALELVTKAKEQGSLSRSDVKNALNPDENKGNPDEANLNGEANTGSNDAGTDTGSNDAGTDTGSNNAGTDTGSNDTGTDTGSNDAGTDTGSNDTGTDTGDSNDTGTDTGGSNDTGTDTGSNDTENDTGKNKAGTEKKKTQVIVSFDENGNTIEGYLLTTKVTGKDGMLWVMTGGLEVQIPAEELKIVRVCYA
ncbi:ParB/RepB/Spo0J family partition protein [Acinetobacter variabilis]|uniref:ParB/RepB/Spo0J family partition protein n=1 Tax=Acinetobacter variabilis TaxID=70346 RepID=UPI0028ACDF40|nr:ParB/RepB/Spo0J family partition protein [Acinetobacter variabilis]